MTLRPALPSDLPDIVRLHEANWRRDYARILPQVALGAGLSAYMAERWCDGVLATSRVFVMRDGDTLLGFAAMLDEGPDGCAFLESLHVAPAARAQGVGRALMSAVVVTAIPQALTLEVLSANTAARQVYRGWGGVESREFIDEILESPVPAVTVGWRDTFALAERLSGDV
jgi:ribosomal protein S18 acetylase RimI-like enzyme